MSTSNTRSVGSCCFRVQKFESIVYKNKNYEDYAYNRRRPNILCVNDLAKTTRSQSPFSRRYERQRRYVLSLQLL